MMKQAAAPKCPKCDEQSKITCLGKRHSFYPAGCLMIVGLPFAALHQASCPIDYECQTCSAKFGIRSFLAKLNLIFLWLLILSIPGIIIFQIISL